MRTPEVTVKLSSGTSCLKERRRRVSKDVPEHTNGAAIWIILRDAVLRTALKMSQVDEPSIPTPHLARYSLKIARLG
jgi:hypothetical protein